jgi:hypothetical protein
VVPLGTAVLDAPLDEASTILDGSCVDFILKVCL